MPTIDSLRRGAATAPAHITGFFEIHDTHRDVGRRGSRGAGINLDVGATTYVEISPADHQEIEVRVNGEVDKAPVTRAEIRNVLQEALVEGRVAYDREAPPGERAAARVVAHTTLDLPVSQGFGMSGAGALSAALACTRALGLARGVGVRAAHAADVEGRGGLGDVAAQSTGGFEVRVTPGLPPYGEVRSLVAYGEVVMCVLGEPLETRAILGDAAKRKRVNARGGRAVDALLKNPNLDNFLTLSRDFAESTGLMSPEVEDAVSATRSHGLASMAMLGNSVFAIGFADELERVLRPYGDVYRAEIDDRGARYLDVEIREDPPTGE